MNNITEEDQMEQYKYKLFWAPNSNWVIRENILYIDHIAFDDQAAKVFPEFYFICNEGSRERYLIERFREELPTISEYIKKMKEHEILIDGIQTTDQLFAGQDKLFQPARILAEDYFFHEENVKKYREDCLSKQKPFSIYRQLDSSDPENFLKSRRSVRSFDTHKVIAYEQFGSFLSVMSQYTKDNERYYCYPSAGGLYPIDLYLYVKSGRIQNIAEGLYLYDPVSNTLNQVGAGESIKRTCHYYLNREIFESSAFSIYLIYNSEVTMPKYHSEGYYYAMLDAGIIVAYLNIAGQKYQIDQCSIGAMKFKAIEKEFKLTLYQRYLHCIEFGMK